MQTGSWAQRFLHAGFLAMILAAIGLLGVGPAYRLEWIGLGLVLQISKYATMLAILALGLTVLGLILPNRGDDSRRPLRTTLTLLVAGALTLQMLNVVRTANSVPRIHDISTDVVNPPAFIALVDERADASNPLEYPGEETAQQQIEAYPDIVSIRLLGTTPAQAIERARAAAESLGWHNITSVPQDGRLEATDTTFWFGYKDDVVVRAVADGGDVVVDVRSKSRVGQSDLGKNAARIREFRELITDS